jgi:hypothetical protein
MLWKQFHRRYRSNEPQHSMADSMILVMFSEDLRPVIKTRLNCFYSTMLRFSIHIILPFLRSAASARRCNALPLSSRKLAHTVSSGVYHQPCLCSHDQQHGRAHAMALAICSRRNCALL